MSHDKKSQKLSFSRVKETCPDVDAAFYNLELDLYELTKGEVDMEAIEELIARCSTSVKEKTTDLRNGLTSLCEDYYDLEAEFERQEKVVQDLQEEIRGLEFDIEDLNHEIRDNWSD